MYFEYICWKFTGRLLDCVNTLLDTNEDVAQMFQIKRVTSWLHAPISSSEMLFDVTGLSSSEEIVACSHALAGHYCCKFTHVR